MRSKWTYTILLAAALMALAACSDSDDVGATADSEIVFTVSSKSSSVSKSTTAKSNTRTRSVLANEVPNVIGITAYSFTGSFDNNATLPSTEENLQMVNDRSTVTNGRVTTSQRYYWPKKNINIRFYAFGPYTELINYVSTAETPGPLRINEYTTSEPTKQADLLVAQTDDYMSRNSQTVLLPFRHIMSALRFKLPDDDQGRIDSVSITGQRTHASYLTGSGWRYQSASSTDTCTLRDTKNESMILLPQSLPEEAQFKIYYTAKEGKKYKITVNFENKSFLEGIVYVFTVNVGEHSLGATLYDWNSGQVEDLSAFGDYPEIIPIAYTLYDWGEGGSEETDAQGNFLYVINLGSDLKDWNEGAYDSEYYNYNWTGIDYPWGLQIGDSVNDYKNEPDTNIISHRQDSTAITWPQ